VVQSTGDWKLDRRLARHLAKQQKQAIEDHYRSPLEGWVMLAAAGGLAVMAMLHGADMWWLLFPAMGIGTGGARIIGKRTWQAGAPPAPVLTPAPPETPRPLPVKAAPEVDPRDERVDAICDKILKEVERGSKVVTELIRDPKETVKTLRLTCRELTRRERELRTLTTPEDEARLAAERTGLTERIAAEKDDVVRQRLASALQALDDQRKQREEITVAAKRFDAEHTRISYAMESLYTQIIRLRSADSASVDVAGAGLRSSLDDLGQHMNAVADALEAVNRGELSQVTDVASPAAEPSSSTRLPTR
jgi:hypothetical protein